MENIIIPEKEESFSKKQMIFLAVVLVVLAVFFLNRQSGWLDRFFGERVIVPQGAAYAEAIFTGDDMLVIIAERIARSDAGNDGAALPKRLEILTDEKTVFAKITSSGPVKISRAEFLTGDVIWIYNRARSFEDTLAEPIDPDLAVPFGESISNPREQVRADFVVKMGK